jgi:5-keto-L-gluconate epimerase
MKLALTYTPTDIAFGPIVLRKLPLAEAFAQAAAWGFTGLEIHLRHPRDIDWDEAHRLQQHYGLAVTTLGTGMAGVMDGLTFGDADDAVRRRTVNLVKEYIHLASLLGSAVTIGFLNGRIGNDPAQRPSRRQAVVECYRECAATAKDQKVFLLCEPLNRYECDYLNTVADGLALLEEIGADNVLLLCDTFHMNIEEVDINAALRQARSRLGYIHLADSNRQAPGRGHTPLVDVLRTLKQINYEGPIGFEYLPMPDASTAAHEGMLNVCKLWQDLIL